MYSVSDIDRRQPHLQHQAPDPFAADTITLPLEMPGHLPCAIPGCLQKLLIDHSHQLQVEF